ncbi:hypothetical protein COOONC_00015 [Cooperia oncophora]
MTAKKDGKKKDPPNEDLPPPKKNVVYPIEELYVDDPKKNAKAYEVNSENKEVVETEKKDTKKQAGIISSYGVLYGFADRTDVQLMSVGLICALLQSAIPPFVWLVMGSFVSFSITREEERLYNTSGAANGSKFDEDFAASATPAFIIMVALSIGMFFAAFIQRLAWEVSAIRQVFRVRRTYVRKVLHMDVAWLENRQSGQMATMLQE